jgi:(1->4)-alpha-D-glucan 1-alpha-D-glucosylmutase
VREAKVHTGWLKPDAAYEQAYVNFVEQILEASEANQFLNDFVPFTKKIAYYGMFNSLSQTLLKMVVPGVPDFYQGAELWDLSLVDPDNRRPVDFVHRAKLIKEIISAESKDPSALRQGLLSEWQDGRIKLYLIYKVLNFRRAHSELFLGGDYIPLAAFGEMGKHVCAFARHNGDVWAVTVVPRLIAKLVAQERVPLGEEFWRSTALRLPGGAPDHWRNVLTGEHLDASVLSEKKVLPLRSVFRDFPVALLSQPQASDEPNVVGKTLQAGWWQRPIS